jgi:NitT/TauT family transport system ATP-binding protein
VVQRPRAPTQVSRAGGVTIATRILVEGVSHRLGDTDIIRTLDLTIEAGSFVALVGPSGSGKSTLLRLVSGLDVPAVGKIERTGGAMAFVFQDAQLLPWRTVLDNVALPLELAGVPKAAARERARAPLADVELADAADRFPDQLSGGMRMRVSIARALINEPELLLLDEPFAALDELTRQRLDERLRELFLRKRMTVLFVTHALAEAVFLADRALVFSPRPARLVLDHPIRLPEHRSGALRSELPFVEQTAALYRALERSGSLDEANA